MVGSVVVSFSPLALFSSPKRKLTVDQTNRMTTLLEPRVTLAYLAYLGYPHTAASSSSTTPLPSTSALVLTRPRKQDRKKGVVQRNVFLGYVLGAAGSGKTSLLKAFVGEGKGKRGGGGVGKHEPTTGRGKTVVNSVETGGGEKYLVVSAAFCGVAGEEGLTPNWRGNQLQEFGSNYESEMLRHPKKLALADVLIFVYDSSDTNSFSYISNLRVSRRSPSRSLSSSRTMLTSFPS